LKILDTKIPFFLSFYYFIFIYFTNYYRNIKIYINVSNYFVNVEMLSLATEQAVVEDVLRTLKLVGELNLP